MIIVLGSDEVYIKSMFVVQKASFDFRDLKLEIKENSIRIKNFIKKEIIFICQMIFFGLVGNLEKYFYIFYYVFQYFLILKNYFVFWFLWIYKNIGVFLLWNNISIYKRYFYNEFLFWQYNFFMYMFR